VSNDSIHRAVFESALDAMLLFGDDGIVTDVNEAACHLAGLPRAAFLGRHFRELHPPDAQEHAVAVHRKMLAEGTVRGEIDALGARGERVRLEYYARRGIVPGTNLSIVRDVTERHRRIVAGERYAMLSQHARDIVLFVDAAGRIVESNDAAERAYGYTREELLALTVFDLRRASPTELVRAQMKQALVTQLYFEATHFRKDGSSFPVEVATRSASIAGETVLVSVVRDLTERKQMEAKLVQADRLAAVGTLAAGVAHEINNPLAFTMTNLEMLARRLPSLAARAAAPVGDADARVAASTLHEVAQELTHLAQMATIAREGAERVRAIVRDLRAFARADERTLAPVALRDVIESSIVMAQNELRHRGELVREYADVPAVLANEARLCQVFLNLLVNAAHALPERREPPNRVVVRTGLDAAGRVFAEVADNGVGIPEEIIGRVFDPFVTTKPVGEGMGLGLFISHSIVTELGGEISVASVEGEGTTFRVVLAATPDTPRVANEAPAHNDTSARSERAHVLLVDDEIALTSALRTALNDEFRFTVAPSAEEALAELRSGLRPDAILCDVMMPQRTGVDLFEQVEAELPELASRFVFMTGGTLSQRTLAFFHDRGLPTLDKPFELGAVRAALRARVNAAAVWSAEGSADDARERTRRR
jgi:PAS domain S-box-containing protein